jgi:hypothetical protein
LKPFSRGSALPSPEGEVKYITSSRACQADLGRFENIRENRLVKRKKGNFTPLSNIE